MLQRRYPIAVCEIHGRPGTEKKLNNLLMPDAVIAEDHRLQQRRPAELVDVIDIDTRFDQCPYGLDMSALRSRNQRRASIPVGAFQVHAVRQRQFENFEMAARSGIKIRAVLDAVLCVDVGSGLDQRPRGGDIVLMRGDEKRGLAFAVPCIDGGSLRHQSANGVRIVAQGSVEQFAFLHGLAQGRHRRSQRAQDKNRA